MKRWSAVWRSRYKARTRFERKFCSFIAFIALCYSAMCVSAHAQLVSPDGNTDTSIDPSMVVPTPPPLVLIPQNDDPENPLRPPPGNSVTDPARSQSGITDIEPIISDNLDALPVPVRRMRSLIMEAARSGDMEGLRPLIGTGPDMTQLSLVDINTDPIAHLRSTSGDLDGHEILAILLEVLEAGYVHLDAGAPTELYVWPYFVALSLEELSPVQRVELFKLVTAGDYDDMLSFGAYIFFRVGITPEGQWLFFVAGD